MGGGSCKGICQRHKSNPDLSQRYYIRGGKRCQTCEVYINWPGMFCPCCNMRLRVKPRYPRGRRIYEEVMQIKTI